MTAISRWGLLVGACAGLFSVFDVNAGKECTLLDREGNAIQQAYVTYYYSAGTKTIWPWAHYDGSFLIHPDRDGRFRIPMKVHVRFPLVELMSPVRLFIDAYVPRLHNSCTLFDPGPQSSECAQFEPGRGRQRIRMRDLGADPTARFHTLWRLIYVPLDKRQAAPAERREAIAAVRREYDDFLSTYGTVVFENSTDKPGHIRIADWTRESGEFRP